jgi:hypothetical protein
MKVLIADNITWRSYNIKGRLDRLEQQVIVTQNEEDALTCYENFKPNFLFLSARFDEAIRFLEQIKGNFQSKLVILSFFEPEIEWEAFAPYLDEEWTHGYEVFFVSDLRDDQKLKKIVCEETLD